MRVYQNLVQSHVKAPKMGEHHDAGSHLTTNKLADNSSDYTKIFDNDLFYTAPPPLSPSR